MTKQIFESAGFNLPDHRAIMIGATQEEWTQITALFDAAEEVTRRGEAAKKKPLRASLAHLFKRTACVAVVKCAPYTVLRYETPAQKGHMYGDLKTVVLEGKKEIASKSGLLVPEKKLTTLTGGEYKYDADLPQLQAATKAIKAMLPA